MTHLDEKALEAAHKESGWLSIHNRIMTERAIRAYLSALPSSPVSDLVERLEKRAKAMNGSLVGASDGGTYALGYYNQLAAKDDKEAASTLTSLSTRNAELAVENGAWQRNMREAYESFSAMRNDLNELFPMQSAEADLLTGPEWSVACAEIVTAARDKFADLEREVKRLKEAAGNAYRACMSAWACGEPPHRVKTMIEEVGRLGVAIGEAGAAALSTSPQGGEHE